MPSIQRHDKLDCCLVARKQDATTEHSSSQPHCRAFPESPNAIVQQDTFDRFCRTCAYCTLTARFDDIEGLCCKRCDYASNRPVRKVNSSVLFDVPLLLKICHIVSRSRLS
jgi:hypothetical protein